MAELRISTPEEMAAKIAEPEVKGWLLGPPLSFEEAQEMVNQHHKGYLLLNEVGDTNNSSRNGHQH